MGAFDSGDPYHGSTQRRILGTLLHRLQHVPGSAGRLPALLVARVVGDPGGVVIEGTGDPTLARRVVFVEAQVNLPVPGPVALTGLPPRVLQTPSGDEEWIPVDGPTGAPPGLVAGISGAAVDYTWSLPSSEAAPLRLDLLKLRFALDGGLMNLLATIEAYDVTHRVWVVLGSLQDLPPQDADGLRYVELSGPTLLPIVGAEDPKARARVIPDDLVDPASGALQVRFTNRGTDLVHLRLAYVGLDVAGTR
jgi:hypothetical protein